MTQVHLFISGRVQGVGFRQFVKSYARTLKLSGFTRNLLDGRVEVVAVGDKERLTRLIRDCKQGPRGSQVSDLEIIWEEIRTIYSDFSILT